MPFLEFPLSVYPMVSFLVSLSLHFLCSGPGITNPSSLAGRDGGAPPGRHLAVIFDSETSP